MDEQLKDDTSYSVYGEKTNAFKTLMDKIYFHRLPSYGNSFFFSLGFLALTCLVVLVITGTTLAFMGQTWWLHDPWGIYTRSVHLWTVQIFIAVLILHITVGFLTSGFRPPRRMVWVFGAIIFALVLIQTEFGYGLRGDFSSQYRAVSGADFWNGAYLGYLINPLNYSQSFAIHIAIIPLTIFFLFILHYTLERTYGISRPLRKDASYTMVPADHTILFIRGGVVVTIILALAFFFHSPYVPAITIASTATTNSRLVASTLLQEMDRTSDTATYLDSIDPYTFDTRVVYIEIPYAKFALSDTQRSVWNTFETAPSVVQDIYIQQAKRYFDDIYASQNDILVTDTTQQDMVGTTNPVIAILRVLLPMAKSGLYESVLSQENPSANSTYTLRFLSDMGVLEQKATSLNMDTAQWGMAKDEKGGIATLPPGSWWLLPLGITNSVFNLLDNPQGDKRAAEILGSALLLFIVFPYVPYLNRLPEFINLAWIIQKDTKRRKKTKSN